MKSLRLFVLTGLFLLTACTSAKQEVAVFSQAVSPEARINCSRTVPSCSSANNASLCQVDVRSGKSIQRIRAWGKNRCYAVGKLHSQVCALENPDKIISTVDCIPDPSRGECPSVFESCDDTDSSPTTCFATAYGSQAMSWEQRPQTWGKGLCRTKNALMKIACDQNLRPSLFRDVVCEPDVTRGKCPPKEKFCDPSSLTSRKCFVREFGDILLDPAWVVTASSDCQGIQKIKQMACKFINLRNQLKMDLLGEINCRADEASVTVSP